MNNGTQHATNWLHMPFINDVHIGAIDVVIITAILYAILFITSGDVFYILFFANAKYLGLFTRKCTFTLHGVLRLLLLNIMF